MRGKNYRRNAPKRLQLAPAMAGRKTDSPKPGCRPVLLLLKRAKDHCRSRDSRAWVRPKRRAHPNRASYRTDPSDRFVWAPCPSTPLSQRKPPRLSAAAAGAGKGPRNLQVRRPLYGKTISTRRFCGSRTPSGVGTRRSFLPRPLTTMSLRGTPRRSSAAATALARRSESRWL